MIYFISDFHFLHKNILKYESVRTEKNVNEEKLVNNCNEVVKKDDTLYVLGDVFCGSYTFMKESRINEEGLQLIQKNIISNINCKDKILIKGNHDNYKDEYYLELGFKEVLDYKFLNYKGYKILLSHYPLYEEYFKNYFKDKEKGIKLKHKETLSKFFGDFDFNIHGHLHSKNYHFKNNFNVSVENVNFYPISIEEILKSVDFW